MSAYRSPVSLTLVRGTELHKSPPVGNNTCRRCNQCYRTNCGYACPGKFVDMSPLALKSCSIEKPYRWGFLWLRRCRVEDLHIHYKCLVCGYRGIMQGNDP